MLCITVPLEEEPTPTHQALLQQALDTQVPQAQLQYATAGGWTLGELLTEVLAASGINVSEDDEPEAADR